MKASLIGPLFDGPLDIVGDVHGEIAPLLALMHLLGFDEGGNHPDGRRLVFVGDLTDRSPDSPAVVNLIRQLVESGRAQCVLGNHDLNILLDHRKHDNDWFYGDESRAMQGPDKLFRIPAEFPDLISNLDSVRFLWIVPSKPTAPSGWIGNLIKGTMNFSEEYVERLIDMGYNDTKRIIS